MTNSITIEVKSVYGVKKCYPVCDKAKLFAKIAGSTTLTHATLCYVEQLGFQIISMADADYRQAA